MGFGGSQDKDNMWWWFLKGLEQGIGGFFGKHMDFINNIDLVTGLVWRIGDLLTEVSDFINATITGSINFYDIQSPTFGYRLAEVATITWFALAVGKTVHCFSQNAPNAGLTRSSWTVKKIGMRYTTTT
ncbi:hypothetical protein ES703_46146 [subsurface metagenome]